MFAQRFRVEIGGGQTKSFREFRQGRNAVIGGKRHPYVGHSDLMTEEVEELRQTPVEFERHAAHLRGVGTNLVAEDIVGREADHKQVGRRACAQLLVQHEFLGEFQLVIVGEGSGADNLVEAGGRAIFVRAVSPCGRAERISVAILPLSIPEFFRAMAAVEIAYPLGEIGTVVG